MGIVARISGGKNQKELSLDDQVDHAKEVVTELYWGPVEYRIFATKAKGERLDRPELSEIEAELRTREVDIFVFEDLGRLIRGTTAVTLLGIAVDHGTRVIAPNDCIDTTEETWEEDAISACRDHVGHNAHTSKRIKHKLMNRFLKLGAATSQEIYGYIVPDEAKRFDDWKKDSTATPIIQEGARRLRESLNCTAVADWFNAEGVPVGPYCRRENWNGAMVRRFYGNALLKGYPHRGSMRTVKHHESGRRVPVKNPGGPKYIHRPELAHLEESAFDELNAMLSAKNANFRRKPVNGADPRWRVSRKRTRFPGQLSRCWYCGHFHVWGGNGITANLMCNASRTWNCWNSFGFSGVLAAQRVAACISSELQRLDGFDGQFQELVQAASRQDGGSLVQRWAKLQHDEETLIKQKKNIHQALLEYGPKPMVLETITQIEAAEREFARERRELESAQQRTLDLPKSIGQVREMFEEEFAHLAVDSPDFGDLMRRIVPGFDVYLVRLCDGGHPVSRAKVTIALDGIVPNANQVPGIADLFVREFTIDLFDPPQRERIRMQAVRLAGEGWGPKEIAKRIEEEPTATAVQNALALHRKMLQMGLESPYVPLLEAPDDFLKLRRHKNPKYEFKSVEGYLRPPM